MNTSVFQPKEALLCLIHQAADCIFSSLQANSTMILFACLPQWKLPPGSVKESAQLRFSHALISVEKKPLHRMM